MRRRLFVQHSALSIASLAVAACAGEEDEQRLSPTPSPAPPPAPTPAPTPPPVSITAPYSLPAVGQALAVESVGGRGTGFQAVKPPQLSIDEFTRSLCGSFGSGVFCREYSAGGAYISAATGGHAHPDMVDAVGFDFTTGTWFRIANANGALSVPTGGFVAGITATALPWLEVVGVLGSVPAPPHAYSCAVYIPPGNGGGPKGSFAYGVRSAVGQGSSFSPTAHRMDLASGLWSRAVSAPSAGIADQVGVEYRCLFDAAASRIYIIPLAYHYFDHLPFIDTTTVTTYGRLGTFPTPPAYGSDGCADSPGAILDPRRRLIIRTLQRKLRALDLNNLSAGWQLLQLNNASLLPGRPLGDSELAYHDARDAFYHLPSTGGSTLYKITPPAGNPISNAWTVSTQTISGATLHAHGNDGTNDSGSLAYKSLMYVPAIGMLAWCAFGQHGGAGTAVYPMTVINPA
jgi:hypothetical protein